VKLVKESTGEPSACFLRSSATSLTSSTASSATSAGCSPVGHQAADPG
jgi:hypothetical protein